MDVVLMFLLLLGICFKHFSCVSVVDFEQVNVGWVTAKKSRFSTSNKYI